MIYQAWFSIQKAYQHSNINSHVIVSMKSVSSRSPLSQSLFLLEARICTTPSFSNLPRANKRVYTTSSSSSFLRSCLQNQTRYLHMALFLRPSLSFKESNTYTSSSSQIDKRMLTSWNITTQTLWPMHLTINSPCAKHALLCIVPTAIFDWGHAWRLIWRFLAINAFVS